MLVLILRSAHAEDVRQIRTCVRASRRMRTSQCMRPHASRRIAAQRCWAGGVLVRAAMLLSMRGEDARRILAKRSQRILLGSSPRGAPRDTCVAGTPLRGPIITFSGYGSRLSARFAGVGRHDDCLGRARDEPAVAGNDRRLRSIVSGLLFTMNGATRTCDTRIRRSSETLAPRARGTRTYLTTYIA